MNSPHVIVVGAGIGGLCLAQGLRGAGIEVSVYERDAQAVARQQGYRVHINADGRGGLAHNLPADLFELFLATSGRADTLTPVFDSQLNVLDSWSAGPEEEPLAVDRLTLRQILLTGLGDTVRFGSRFTHYSLSDDGRVTAYFADGHRVTGDVLVAADGVNSAVREQYLPEARIVDAGVRQICGKVWLTEETRKLFLDNMFGVFTPIIGPDRRFVGLGPVRHLEPIPAAVARLAPGADVSDVGDYAAVSFGCRAELLPCSDDELRAMSGAALRDMVLEIIADWHPRVRAMVAHWDAESAFPLILRTSVPIPAWPTSRVTLLGDAIHAMTPAGGVGANTALRDAAALTDALIDVAAGKPVQARLGEYEAAMRDYGFAAVRQSAANGIRVIGQDPLPDHHTG
ncbi:MAG TPA: NAD(P)/FAD-dependent oxidoreductase [Pseudonocardiaceae bacterium]|jgi:2-polyprenyl-6-methoxyphenol hydroxylase-like FAD-dependent oxidoreductase|nr:NAD(P)/FAD-dependent oxidoreductase [Pseudonocardiaceae bacterium]